MLTICEETPGHECAYHNKRPEKSKYKFTLAGRIRSAINKLPEEEKTRLLISLRAEFQKDLDTEIVKPLKEVIWRYNT